MASKRIVAPLHCRRMDRFLRCPDISALPVDEIDLLTLMQANLISQHSLSAKVVLSGEIARKVTLKGVSATRGAKAAIEAAGGSVVE